MAVVGEPQPVFRFAVAPVSLRDGDRPGQTVCIVSTDPLDFPNEYYFHLGIAAESLEKVNISTFSDEQRIRSHFTVCFYIAIAVRASVPMMRLRTVSTVVFRMVVCESALVFAGPVHTYGTYFGGSGDDRGVAVQIDASGSIIIAGWTTSQFLAGTDNAFQKFKAPGFADNFDVFISKFDPTGRKLIWTTFLGGNDLDRPVALYVDAAGSIYVTGETRSSNFPITSGALSSNPSPSVNSFISKISADGRTLLASTYLPNFISMVISANSNGEFFTAGQCNLAQQYVTPGAIGSQNGALSDGICVLKLQATASGVVFGAYLGGQRSSAAVASIVLDTTGNVYVAGTTYVAGFPTTNNAVQPEFSNSGLPSGPVTNNGFITELSPTGSEVIYGTYFGPRYSATSISSLALAPDGSVYFSGGTNATNLQATPGAYLATPAPSYVAGLAIGSPVLRALSYIPFPAPFEYVQTPQLKLILSHPDAMSIVSTTYASGGAAAPGYLELITPTLGFLSIIPVPPIMNDFGYNKTLSSAWLIRSCVPVNNCGSLITPDAYKPSFDTASGPGDVGLIQYSSVSVSRSPDVISLIPSSGSGVSGTFTAVFRHPEGQNGHYLGYILLLPLPNVVQFNAQGTCLIEYNRLGGNFDGKGGMRLINNAGTDWIGRLVGEPVAPTTAPLRNTACTVSIAGTVVTFSGSDMNITVPVSFNQAGVTATMGSFIQSNDVHGYWTDFRQFGNWNVPGAGTKPGPFVSGVSPNTGASSAVTFAITAGHTSGVAQIGQVHFRINAGTIVGGNPCHAVYFPLGNTVALVNDDGTGLVGPVSLGTSINTGRCGIGPGGTRSMSGNIIGINLPMTFNPAVFPGPKNLYVNVFDIYGAVSHWVQVGTWTVQ